MKPFWVGFQLTLGIIAAAVAVPLVLLFVGLANRAPQLWGILLAPALAGVIAVLVNAARKLKHP